MLHPAGSRIEVPHAQVSWHRKIFGETRRGWIDALPDLAADLLDGWHLRPEGSAMCGAITLVLPVRRADGMPAVLEPTRWPRPWLRAPPPSPAWSKS